MWKRMVKSEVFALIAVNDSSKFSFKSCIAEFTDMYAYVKGAQSVFLCFGWHADHVTYVINMQERSVAFEDQSKTTNRPGQTCTADKGKILFFMPSFSPRNYTDVRKIYYLAVHVKTLPKNCFLAVKVAFEVVSCPCWFRNFTPPLNGTRRSLWPLVIYTILIFNSVRIVGCWFNLLPSWQREIQKFKSFHSRFSLESRDSLLWAFTMLGYV